jgi:predicted nucleotidyltransferase
MPASEHQRGSALEGAAVETRDGSLFTVKGILHPPDHIIAYLRYVPDPRGERERGRDRYRRVYSSAEREAALRARNISWRIDDPALGVPVDAVPWTEVARVHDPRARLRELHARGPSDPLETDALALAALLREASGAPRSALGLTGSLLLGLHTPASDIDLVVYGDRECRRVHAALSRLLDDPTSAVARPRGEELTAIHAVHRADTPLSADDFARLQARKANEGRFAGRPFFIRFVKLPADGRERWGDPRFAPAGEALVEARVTGDRDAIFTPCRYALDEVRSFGGAPVDDLGEVISYRGRFAEQARIGHRVRAYGALEHEIWSDGRETLRLVVGSRAGDYLLALEEDPEVPRPADRETP